MSSGKNFLRARVDDEGRILLPPGLVSLAGLKPGARVLIESAPEGLRLHFPERLAKLYIEPTNRCNLGCRTCIRNTWEEPSGDMSNSVFARILEGLRAFSPPPVVFFGGFGEPLLHPDIPDMVSQAVALGSKVELITNGTLLTENLSQDLIQAGLGTLWVSLDGAVPESYSDIRLGAALPDVIKNLERFRDLSYAAGEFVGHCNFLPRTRLGISFVAMKDNIADLPAVVSLGQRLGAAHLLVTNVLPYTREMVDQALYYRAVNSYTGGYLNLPAMDLSDFTYGPLCQAVHNVGGSWTGFNSDSQANQCPFIRDGAGAVRWDGGLSPCLPLLHSHESHLGYLQYEKRFSREWTVGSVLEKDLIDLWNTPEHLAFRERVLAFEFSPCTTCGSCDLMETNEEDCIGNTFPTCGGCLWAQGLIRCP